MVPTLTCGLVRSNLSFAMRYGLLSHRRRIFLSRAIHHETVEGMVFLQSQNGAADGNRTRDLFLTKEVLYRLSHSSSYDHPKRFRASWNGAGDGIRTHDNQLGRLEL